MAFPSAHMGFVAGWHRALLPGDVCIPGNHSLGVGGSVMPSFDIPMELSWSISSNRYLRIVVSRKEDHAGSMCVD